jgi:CubicO group peptidase (beta-lactamase class C family)
MSAALARGLVILGMVLTAGPVERVRAEHAADKIEEYLAACVKRHHFSGSVLVARDGKVLLSKGYGLANREHGVPCTPRTKFRLGSVTKPITALAVLILHEKGKLDLGKPIKTYLPEGPTAWAGVTVRHLLTHTSGIPDLLETDPRYVQTVARPVTPAQLVARFRDKPLKFKPGEKSQYSNSNYVLLGRIIERVSGRRYEEFLQESIFRPLKMTATGYDRARPILSHRAAGYCTWGLQTVNAAPIDLSNADAAGALYSTVEDLFRLDQALYANRLVSAKTLRECFTAHKGKFGYGWAVLEVFGRRFVGHYGGINGFQAALHRYPDDRVCIIVLHNGESGHFNRVPRDLAAILFGKKYTVPTPRKPVAVEPEVLDRYVGRYEVDGKIFDEYAASYYVDRVAEGQRPKLSVTISREGNRLMGQFPDQPKVELLAESPTVFFPRDLDAQVTFVKDKGGAVRQLVLRQNANNSYHAQKARPSAAGERRIPPNHWTILFYAALHKDKRCWHYCRWYTPLAPRNLKSCFGRLAWCRDGATAGNGVVENWFELLDSWYDTTNDRTGGLNGYRW